MKIPITVPEKVADEVHLENYINALKQAIKMNRNALKAVEDVNIKVPEHFPSTEIERIRNESENQYKELKKELQEILETKAELEMEKGLQEVVQDRIESELDIEESNKDSQNDSGQDLESIRQEREIAKRKEENLFARNGRFQDLFAEGKISLEELIEVEAEWQEAHEHLKEINQKIEKGWQELEPEEKDSLIIETLKELNITPDEEKEEK